MIDPQRSAVALAREGSGRRIRRRVGRDHPDEVRAVGHDRRIPNQDGLLEATAERRPLRLSFAPVQHVVNELVVVFVVGSPGERLEALLVRSPAERRGCRRALRGLGGRRELAIGRGLVAEAGKVGFARGKGFLEHDAGRVNRDRADDRAEVSL